MDSENRIVLVTGASSGIGKSIAKRFVEAGDMVYINYVSSKEKAEGVQKELVEAGGNAEIIKADVTNEKDVSNMFDFIKKKHGRLDILVNNAGIDIEAEVENCSYKLWNKIIGVNLSGKFLCTKYATPLLKKSDFASIINIASRMGTKPIPEIVPYCISEAGIIMLTKGTALELSKYDIRVNTVSPGLTRTPLTENMNSNFDKYISLNPLKRLGTPEDIAKTAFFLASTEAEFITGENINVSGGILLK